MGPTPRSGARLRRAFPVITRPHLARPTLVARLLARHRAHRRWHGASGLRSATHALRRVGLARDVLHHGDGTLAHERDGHGLGADAVARGAGRGPGGTEES